MEIDIKEVFEKGNDFHMKLEAVKDQIAQTEFEWYPYYSLSCLEHFDQFLTGKYRFLLDLIGSGPALDICCADGELAFFLESLGCRMQALDYAPTNYNGMRGVRALKEALASNVEIYEADLDGPFDLPESEYSVAFLLGAVYHLKNPIAVLDKLSYKARYCFCSTRIANMIPGNEINLRDLPVAYLLDNKESNNDGSNYWFFSDAGFRRLMKRTNWEICGYYTGTQTGGADRGSLDYDERAFCLARSRFSVADVELLKGFHRPEGSGWRWTEKHFSVKSDPQMAKKPSGLRLSFFVGDKQLAILGPVTVSASVNGVELPSQVYTATGQQVYARSLPPDLKCDDGVRADFWLDKAQPPNETDRRELGIIVTSVHFESGV